MKIRLLTTGDLGSIAEIVRLNYAKKYEKLATSEVKEMFKKSSMPPKYYVVENQDKIIGFAGYNQSMIDYGIYQMFWVNVHPKWQKRGIGKLLVSKVITEIKKKKNSNLIILTADTTKGNEVYYKKNFGFKRIQKLEDGQSSLMSLRLEKDLVIHKKQKQD
jgi:N-acetylglutamate synthase-like GNAT family acetyltransferase